MTIQKNAKQSSQMHEVVVAIAHDIRSPLLSLLMLAKFSETIPEHDRDFIKNEALRIQGIIDTSLEDYVTSQVLDSSSDKVKLVSVSAVILELIAEKEYEYHNSGIHFKCNFIHGTTAFINVHVSNFQRMLSNIINNAIEAYDGKPGIVKLVVEMNDIQVKISIEDQGRGMSEELVNIIRNNVAVTYGKPNGKSIGFVQIRETLANNDGKLLIESTPKIGTKITVVFPRVAAAKSMTSTAKNLSRKSAKLVETSNIISKPGIAGDVRNELWHNQSEAQIS